MFKNRQTCSHRDTEYTEKTKLEGSWEKAKYDLHLLPFPVPLCLRERNFWFRLVRVRFYSINT